MAADFTRPTACKVPRESEGHPPPPGPSFPLDAWLAQAPAAKILWIVRHPLDAICSLRIGIGDHDRRSAGLREGHSRRGRGRSDRRRAAARRWAARVQDSNGPGFVEAVTSRGYSRQDHARRVGRWRENLTEAQARGLWPLVRPAAELFGYSI